MPDDFGDFEEIIENGKNPAVSQAVGENPMRVRMPRGHERIGIIMQRLGGNRMEVQCTDGKVRNCRVPGRFKRSLWLRPRDIVLVEPWENNEDKGDVIFKYSSSAIHQLRKNGTLNVLKTEF